MSSTLRTISIRTAGAGSYSTLADETTGSGADFIIGFNPSQRQIVQSEPLYGSDIPAVFARGNRGWILRFAVQRSHASAEAAAAFIRDHASSIPDQLDIQIVQGAQTTHMLAAALESLGFDEPSGSSTTTHYTFVGPTYSS
jgi:hypothetical protein